MQLDPRMEFIGSRKMESPAVLLLIYKRPEHAALVLAAIRKAKPKKLYVSSDGPNINNPGEEELVKNVRMLIEKIDWDCEVKTNFRKQNLGCRVAVSSAIDWFFEYEEEGIILEDDCLPSQSFFRFCSELLSRYRDDKRIMCISGDNFQQGRSVTSDSYYYSKYNHCWGWATWRRAWSYYDRDMIMWPAFREGSGLLAWSDANDAFNHYWERIFNKAADGEIDSWAYRWTFSCWSQSGLSCLPNRNLVKNIGFDSHATHTKGGMNWIEGHEAHELEFPLSHPAYMVRNIIADKFTDFNCFEIQDNKIKKFLLPNMDKLRNRYFYKSLLKLFSRMRKA